MIKFSAFLLTLFVLVVPSFAVAATTSSPKEAPPIQQAPVQQQTKIPIPSQQAGPTQPDKKQSAVNDALLVFISALIPILAFLFWRQHKGATKAKSNSKKKHYYNGPADARRMRRNNKN
jgi:hypothetical protein